MKCIFLKKTHVENIVKNRIICVLLVSWKKRRRGKFFFFAWKMFSNLMLGNWEGEKVIFFFFIK